MADNTQLNPGSGGDISAADDIGGIKYQRVKLVLGDDGVAEGDVSSTRALPVTDDTARNFLWRILQMLMAPLGYDKSLQRYRGTTLIESGTVTTVTTVTTCATVTGLTNINGRNGDMLINSNGNAAWALCVRARIT